MDRIKQILIQIAANINNEAYDSANHIKDVEMLNSLQSDVKSNPYFSKENLAIFNDKTYPSLLKRLTIYNEDQGAINQLKNLRI